MHKWIYRLACIFLYKILRRKKKWKFNTRIVLVTGTLIPIMNQLWMDNIISSDAFLTWKSKTPEAKEDLAGHSVSLVALTSFFTDLQEPDDNSSVEELSTSAKQEECWRYYQLHYCLLKRLNYAFPRWKKNTTLVMWNSSCVFFSVVKNNGERRTPRSIGAKWTFLWQIMNCDREMCIKYDLYT